MPELPEVETIVRDLKKKVLQRTFIDSWSDAFNLIKKPKSFKEFKKGIKGKKVKKIWRSGKNIIFELSSNKTLLIHQKLTGHLLLGEWKLKKRKWVSRIKGPLLSDPRNRFLHLVFWLDNGKMLALSDLRKFAKVELYNNNEFEKVKEINGLGPEPLEKSFNFNRFKKALNKKNGKIKQVLMDQTVIAGIGNIYSDEILWKAKVHPLKKAGKLKEGELRKIYNGIKTILPLAIKLRGESIIDFRTLSGEKGYFDKARKVYQREGEKCSYCGGLIKRLKLGGRSAHFCSKCQKL